MSAVKNSEVFAQNLQDFRASIEKSKLERTIGSNGLQIGAKYTIVDVDLLSVRDSDGNETAKYLAFILNDGSAVSVASAVPPTSFSGFIFSDSKGGGKAVHTVKHDQGEEPETIQLAPTAQEAKVRQLWNTPARSLGGLIDFFADTENLKTYIGAELYFHGIAYKQTTAKRAGQFSEEYWQAGDLRAIPSKLYSITPKSY